MKYLIDYIRQIFCKHDWQIEEGRVDGGQWLKSGTKVYMRCKKCGYHKNHWKFL